MKSVIVGIVGKPSNDEKSLWKKQKITDDFRKILVGYGAVVIGVLPTNCDYNNKMTDDEKKKYDYILNLCDGIILQGGLQTGEHEIYAAKYAIENDIPILGTCCGFNNMLFSLNDKVQKDTDEGHNIYDKNYRHNVIIKENSKLFNILNNNEIVGVNSIHKIIAKDSDISHFNIVAHDEEGNVEAVELPEKLFCLGVKWHPEIMTDDENMMNIFKSFYEACCLKNNRK